MFSALLTLGRFNRYIADISVFEAHIAGNIMQDFNFNCSEEKNHPSFR
jgi:hypothetical protein